MSTKLQKYLCAENGGGSIVVANRTKASGWETFRVGSSIQTHIYTHFQEFYYIVYLLDIYNFMY